MKNQQEAIKEMIRFGNVQAVKIDAEGNIQIVDTSGKRPKKVFDMDKETAFEDVCEAIGLRVFHEVEDEQP